MPTTYAEFDSTPATLVADLKTRITASTDWVAFTGGGLTNTVKATTTRGAEMVVMLDSVAPTVQRAQFRVFRTHNGTTGTDPLERYVIWKTETGGTTALPLHCVVSAGKDHLFIAIEGPYAGETGASATNGSYRQSFFLGELLPYFAADTVPAVVLCAHTATALTTSNVQLTCVVSRNQANTASWVPARLGTVSTVDVGALVTDTANLNPRASDGNTYLWPWVVAEQAAGMRGRLKEIYFAGHSGPVVLPGEYQPLAGDDVTFGGRTYRSQRPMAGPGVASADNPSTPWGVTYLSGTGATSGPLLYVPRT